MVSCACHFGIKKDLTVFCLSVIDRYLAFENNIIKDYVSEKVFDGLLAGTVPVYYGATTVDKLLPNLKSVVKVSDFSSPKDLAAYLKDVGNDEMKYNAFLQWKKSPKMDDVNSFQKVIDSTGYKFTALCRICQKLAESED